jgi:NitT/TauT family transport system substrate-binding protein
MAKHDLSAQITLMNGGAAIASAITGGSLDCGESDVVTLAQAHDQGLSFILVAPGVLHSNAQPTLALVVGDAAMQSGKDFNGKTMACNVARGFGSLVTNVWIDNNGGDSKTVKWAELPFPALSAALQRGTIDGYCAPEPFVTIGVRNGGHLVKMENKPIAPVILQGGWFVSRDFLTKNPVPSKDFALAIRDANDWANKNRTAADQILSKYSQQPVAQIEGMMMRATYQLQFNLATIQPLIDAAAKYGFISKGFRATDIVATNLT